MGLLTPSKNEILLQQRMWEEKFKLIGVEGFYYEVKNLNLDKTNNRDRVKYFEPIAITFLFEEMPNPKTLRGLHWWDDNDETTPPIAYLPWHINQEKTYELKPTVGSKIELTDPLGGESRFYEIQEVNANTLYKVYSTVKLTPLREEMSIITNTVETKVESIEEKIPSVIAPEIIPNATDYQFINKPLPKIKEKKPDSGYTFLNVDGRAKK